MIGIFFNLYKSQNYFCRLILQAIAMTASDLSASAKPWDIQFKTAHAIFEEFYEQVSSPGLILELRAKMNTLANTSLKHYKIMARICLEFWGLR